MTKEKGMKCINCGKIAKSVKLSFQGQKIEGWKCSCGEEYFDPAQAQRILHQNKMKYQIIEAKLGKIKSNLILRIPKAIEEALGLEKGEKIKMKIKDSKLEISSA